MELPLVLLLGFLGAVVFRMSYLWVDYIRKDVTKTGRKFPWLAVITFLVLYWGAYAALVYIGFADINGIPYNTSTTSMGITLIVGVWVSTNSILVPFITSELSPTRFLVWMGAMSILITAIIMMTFHPLAQVAS